MTLNRDTLELIQETAVAAEEPEIYRIGPREQLRFDKVKGEKTTITEGPPEHKNEVLTIADAIRIFRDNPQSSIWVSDKCIFVWHDTAERLGKTCVPVQKSPAAEILLKADKEMTTVLPEEFEKIAMLRFGCGPEFIQTLRNLQWNQETKESAQISNVNKSISATELVKVLKRDGMPFEDVSITVVTPMFEEPNITSDVEIEVSVIANAQRRMISFAPAPGVMRRHLKAATMELYEAVFDLLTPEERDRLYTGSPVQV